VYRSEGNDLLLAADPVLFRRPEALVKDPDKYDENVDEETVKTFLKETPLILPPMKRASYRGGHSGVYDCSPDESPIIGKIPELQGFYICCGWTGLGFGPSPAMSEIMAELITEDKTTLIDWSTFRLSRFKEGKPLASTFGTHH